MGLAEDDQGERLRQLVAAFERSPDLVLAIDRAGQVVARNAAAARHAPDATSLADLAGASARPAAEAALAAVFAHGRAETFECGDRGPGGIVTWFSAVLTPVDHAGALAGALCIAREVTEQKRVEERLRRSEQLMVDTQGVAHLGTWEWDVREPTATWSAELYRIYGLTPETYAPSYERYLTMVHPDDRQRVIDATNQVFHAHVPYSHDERIFRPDGSIRYLHTWAYPVLDEQGTLVRLVGVCQDITDRKQAEEALQRLNLELEHRVSERTHQLEVALRDLESFNSMVSHDLRAPLAVISMAAELIEREAELPPRVPGSVAKIRRSVANMSQLLSDLLAFSRAGQDAVEPELVDVSAVAAEVVGELRATAPDRAVEIAIAPGLRVAVDASLFRVVLSNLLGNAWKYTGRSAAARIELGETRRGGDRALVVRDNGIGFDAGERERLFAPFVRLANAAGFAGTGIGLATVHRIVERHGGRIEAEGAPGEGASFYLVLPAAAWP